MGEKVVKTCEVRVRVTRAIQLNKFEPVEIVLEEVHYNVPVSKASDLQNEIYEKLEQSIAKKLNKAIKAYRRRGTENE